MKKTYFILSVTVLLLVACKKEEGKGGRHAITGKVFARTYDPSFTVLLSQYYAQEETVYIIYGDETTYGDSQKTNYDGTYQFPYLQKGEYTIYVYSKDSTSASPSGKKTIIKNVTIGKEKNITLSDFDIIK